MEYNYIVRYKTIDDDISSSRGFYDKRLAEVFASKMSDRCYYTYVISAETAEMIDTDSELSYCPGADIYATLQLSREELFMLSYMLSCISLNDLEVNDSYYAVYNSLLGKIDAIRNDFKTIDDAQFL